MLSLPLLTGFGTGLSLIAAIGAQNAFVLRQGLRRQHVWVVVLVCAVSDAVLIFAGIAGLGFLVSAAPWILSAARIGGALFLLTYAAFAAKRALHPAALTVEEGAAGPARGSVILTALALTWLNPHVYLDTVVLLGSVASAQGDPGRWYFGLGAVLASIIWFGALGFGARLLHGFFAKPLSWRILDAAVAVVMLVIACLLIAPLF